MLQRKLVLFLILALPLGGFAQQISRAKSPEIPGTAKYIAIIGQLGNTSIRDFATSPLTYKGLGKTLGLSRVKSGSRKIVETGLSYTTGNLSNAFNADFPTHTSFKMMQLAHSRLRHIQRWSGSRNMWHLGGQLNVTGLQRINTSLQNNALGLEILPSLLASARFTRNISRMEAKNKRFLFWKYVKAPKERYWSFRLDAGLLNGAYRNGYAYMAHSGTFNAGGPTSGYEFHLGGKRLETALDYTVRLKNKNLIQYGYRWRAYTTKEQYDIFELGQHALQVTLFFNTNNK